MWYAVGIVDAAAEDAKMTEVTQILMRIDAGDPSASEELLPLVYGELRQLAKAYLDREKPGQTLQPTALVHDAFLRLTKRDGESTSWNSRGHFFGAAARAMRQILVDAARRKRAEIHGGGMTRVPLTVADPVDSNRHWEFLELDEAFQRLEEADPQALALVELRFFAGLTIEQAAQVLGISPRTAKRRWQTARTLLRVFLDPNEK